MYQSGQRDASRPFQVPPPPPPMSPPLSQMNGMASIPPPPPRFPGAPGVLLPPPPGPPPTSAFPSSALPPPSALGQAPWHGTWGRMYDGRTTFNIPPPPPGGGQHQAYNPKLHAGQPAGHTLVLPPPPPLNDQMGATYVPQGEQMSATYIPQGDTYGEGVGIPALRTPSAEEMSSMQAAMAQVHNNSNTANGNNWYAGQNSGDASLTTTPLDDVVGKDRLYAAQMQGRMASTTSNATTSSGIPPELAAQWTMDKVVLWLEANQFSKDWQETFKALNIHGAQFLELGGRSAGRGNFGLMHQQVYPRLLQECNSNGTRWDQTRQREEGKRMRRLLRSIITNRPVDTSKTTSTQYRDDGQAPNSATESPNVSFMRDAPFFFRLSKQPQENLYNN